VGGTGKRRGGDQECSNVAWYKKQGGLKMYK
jgi:hypothetical protein